MTFTRRFCCPRRILLALLLRMRSALAHCLARAQSERARRSFLRVILGFAAGRQGADCVFGRELLVATIFVRAEAGHALRATGSRRMRRSGARRIRTGQQKRPVNVCVHSATSNIQGRPAAAAAATWGARTDIIVIDPNPGGRGNPTASPAGKQRARSDARFRTEARPSKSLTLSRVGRACRRVTALDPFRGQAWRQPHGRGGVCVRVWWGGRG